MRASSHIVAQKIAKCKLGKGNEYYLIFSTDLVLASSEDKQKKGPLKECEAAKKERKMVNNI